MVDGVTQTKQDTIFFLRDSCWMWPCVIKEKHNDSLIDECKMFSLKIFMNTLQLSRIQVSIKCLTAI